MRAQDMSWQNTNIWQGSSFSKQEHTVINIGDPDGVPRLVSIEEASQLAQPNFRQITCVRSSQGYEWNPGLLYHTSGISSHTDKVFRDLPPILCRM